MARIALTDEPGRWFETKSAEKFDESSWHDGQNFISRATGSQWDHEALYRTASGVWILNHWSQWQGSRETYEQVDDTTAVAWLIRNKRFDDVPEVFLQNSEL